MEKIEKDSQNSIGGNDINFSKFKQDSNTKQANQLSLKILNKEHKQINANAE